MDNWESGTSGMDIDIEYPLTINDGWVLSVYMVILSLFRPYQLFDQIPLILKSKTLLVV